METNLFQHGADWALFFSTFTLVFWAELPDKTFVAILILASRHHPLAIFTGIAIAFVIQNIVAVLFGSVLGLLPPHIIHMGSGILFLVFAVFMWIKKEEKSESSRLKEKVSFLKTAWTAFIVIFIAEWGDLTQLASATLVAQTHHPVTIFLASTLALWSTTALAVLIGHHGKKAIHPYILQKIAAVAFGIVGILLLSGFWDK
jgi:putative Ca2+/H+ antiporter (TMEM165/GDT1 family)